MQPNSAETCFVFEVNMTVSAAYNVFVFLYPPSLPSMANVRPPLAVRRTGLEGNLLTRLEMLLLAYVYVDP